MIEDHYYTDDRHRLRVHWCMCVQLQQTDDDERRLIITDRLRHLSINRQGLLIAENKYIYSRLTLYYDVNTANYSPSLVSVLSLPDVT